MGRIGGGAAPALCVLFVSLAALVLGARAYAPAVGLTAAARGSQGRAGAAAFSRAAAVAGSRK